MKQFITPDVFGQMVILSTIISDNCLMFKDRKHKQKRAYNKVQENYNVLIKKIVEDYEKESIYNNWDLLDVHFKDLKTEEIIYTCSAKLKDLLNRYDFNTSYYNKFKAIWKNSLIFSKQTDFDFILFSKDLIRITENNVIIL